MGGARERDSMSQVGASASAKGGHRESEGILRALGRQVQATSHTHSAGDDRSCSPGGMWGRKEMRERHVLRQFASAHSSFVRGSAFITHYCAACPSGMDISHGCQQNADSIQKTKQKPGTKNKQTKKTKKNQKTKKTKKTSPPKPLNPQ